jgi:hypothetical protein
LKLVWLAEAEMEIQFNIIYTTGTVKHLRLFVFSLLKWSDSAFRLVANACSPQEMRLLRELCQKSPRLEFLALPYKRPSPHDKTLSYLQSIERSDYFCFMDSDMLATGDFMGEMSPYLRGHAGVFSGSPIWCTKEEQVLPATLPRVRGQFSRTADGVCLGSSYFAIYDNRVLTQFIQSTGIDFRRYWWREVAPQHQGLLAGLGLKKDRFDTGKLLNVLLPAEDKPIVFVDSQFLQHIGSVSIRGALKASSHPVNLLKSTRWGPAVKLRQWIKRLRGGRASAGADGVTLDAERAEIHKMRGRMMATAVYFDQLFDSLFENKPLPPVPHVDDPAVEERVGSVTAHIVSLYGEFEQQLEPSAAH